jgi:hypothetical protein
MESILASLTRDLTIANYDDWLMFVERLGAALRSGSIRKVAILKRVWSDYEEWFLDPATGEIYVYLEPDAPILPRWERVDVLRHLEAPDAAPLSVFKTGQISVMTAHIMRIKIESLVSGGLVEELGPPRRVASLDRTERWFRDKVSNVVYCLSEHYGLEEADDIRWEAVSPPEPSGEVR